MKFLEKNRKLLILFLKNTIVTFLILLILHFTNVFDINHILRFRYVMVIVLSLFTFYLFLFFEGKKEKKDVYQNYFKKIFLFSLVLISVANLEQNIIKDLDFLNFLKEFLLSIENYIFALTILTGLFTFYFNADRIQKNIEQDKQKDLYEEKKKEEGFKQRFKKIGKIPILKDITKRIYKEGVGYIIILLTTIFITITISLPYYNTNFDGEHRIKYSAFVEPALNMYHQGDIFHYQKNYEADPVYNKSGVLEDGFGLLPLNEWGLFSTFQITGIENISKSTHIFTKVLGILSIIALYFFSKLITKKIFLPLALLIIFNPIFNLSSYLVTADIWNIIFGFSAIYLLTISYLKKKDSFFVFSGLLGGLSIATKLSGFIWLIPILIIIISAFENNKVNRILKRFVFISIYLVLPYLLTKFLLYNIFGLILAIAIIFIFIISSSKIKNFIFNKLNEKILYILFALGLILSPYLINLMGLEGLVKNFITDINILFSYEVYLTLFKTYLSESLGLMMVALFFAFMPILIFWKNKKLTFTILSSFALSILIYIVIASKSLFVNYSYYFIVFCFLIYTINTVILYYLLYRGEKIVFKALIICVFILFSSTMLYESNFILGMKKIEDYEKVQQFVLENTEEGDFILDDSFITPVTIGTNRSSTRLIGKLDNEVIKNDIREIGFAKTMEKYNIKFLMTFHDEPNYEKYAHILIQNEHSYQDYDRTRRILSRIGNYSMQRKDYKKLARYFEFYERVGNVNVFIFRY